MKTKSFPIENTNSLMKMETFCQFPLEGEDLLLLLSKTHCLQTKLSINIKIQKQKNIIKNNLMSHRNFKNYLLAWL